MSQPLPIKIQKDLDRMKRIRKIMRTAERWVHIQMMPEGTTCMAALKDIQRTLRS